MKVPLIKHSSKISAMIRDSSEKIFACHNVFQAIEVNVLLINKGKAKNTEKILSSISQLCQGRMTNSD